MDYFLHLSDDRVNVMNEGLSWKNSCFLECGISNGVDFWFDQIISQWTSWTKYCFIENHPWLSIFQWFSIDWKTTARWYHFILLFLHPFIDVSTKSTVHSPRNSFLCSTNVLLMEELTFDLVSRSLPFISDATTVAYQSILIESMCYFCLELLSLSTLPIDQTHEEHSHYHLGKKLLQSIHQSNNHRTGFIIKSYLNTIKHLQFQYMNREQLEVLFDLIVQVRQVSSIEKRSSSKFIVLFQYPNLPLVITSTIKHIEEQIQSNLKLIDKLVNIRNIGMIRTLIIYFRRMAIETINDLVHHHHLLRSVLNEILLPSIHWLLHRLMLFKIERIGCLLPMKILQPRRVSNENHIPIVMQHLILTTIQKSFSSLNLLFFIWFHSNDFS